MRKDMSKVVVERVRTRSWKSGRARTLIARVFADSATPLTGRRAALLAGESKALSDYLAPLRRYLRSQVGRPWRKVHSEICARLDQGNTVQKHVLGHLDAFIVSRISVGRHGEWLAASGRRAGEGVDDWTAPLYVDPDDGLIKETARLKRKLGLDPRLRWKRRAEPSPDSDRVVLGPDEELRRLDGVWFRVRLGATVKPSFDGPRLYCAGTEYRRSAGTTVGAAWRQLLGKRQLTTRELAKAGLANAPR